MGSPSSRPCATFTSMIRGFEDSGDAAFGMNNRSGYGSGFEGALDLSTAPRAEYAPTPSADGEHACGPTWIADLRIIQS